MVVAKQKWGREGKEEGAYFIQYFHTVKCIPGLDLTE